MCVFSLLPKWADVSNLLETVALVVMLNSIVTGIFLLCEPGARMSTKFEMFSEELEQCDWHLLPIEIQRMYIIFLSDSQQPVMMSSYGGIMCERETSKKVLSIYGRIQIHDSIQF